MADATLRRPQPDEFRPGLILESRDRQYEPGRRIKLLEPSHDGGNPIWTCETIANPQRPHRVGSVAAIRQAVFRTRWGIPSADGGDPS